MQKNIALIYGDCSSPEIVKQTIRVLDKVAEKYGHTFHYTDAAMGGEAIDKFGDPLPQSELDKCLASDSVLLGAVGGPKWEGMAGDKRPEKGLLRLRAGMGLYANNRPARIWPQLAPASPLKPEIVAKGIDFIICDHHVPDEVLPPAVAILNAKREDNTYPYEHLSGCGVGFKFMQAFAISNGIEFHHLIPLLDLVAVSIASDIVPIMGENRILAYHGLRQLNSNPSVGLKSIIDVCGLSEREINMSDIVFKIGPRINASGRIQNGKEAVDLLIEKDYQAAKEKSNLINQYNETRKDLDKNMTEEANKIVDNLEHLDERRSIVIYNEDWHKGVIGIVASRLTEIYYRPAVVLTRTDNLATGSARSVSGFDVYKAIEYCRDLLENFGGHTYAAGLSMKIENVEEFSRRFEEYVTQNILPEQTSATIQIDAHLDFRDITPKFFFDLKKFNPFGPDNHKPIFATLNVYDYGTSKVVGRDQEHIKLELVDNKSNNVMNGIAFGQSSQARYIKTKQSFNICYTIEENTHRRGEIQLQIEDIKPSRNKAL